jgi:tol-pal system protein YbgF
MLSIATSVFAEDAPVYDVDSYPPQFDGNQAPANHAPDHSADHAQAQTQGLPPAPSNFSAGPGAMPQQDAPPPTEPELQAQAVPTPPTQSLSNDQRLARLENAVHSDVNSKVADMQTEIQTLRGQVEDLTHQLQQVQSQQKTPHGSVVASNATPDEAPADDDTAIVPKSKKGKKATLPDASADADKGLPAIATTPVDDQPSTASTTKTTTTTTATTTTASASQPNVAEEQQIYQTAYNLIKAKKYSDAADTLQKMLQKYPTGQFAANAHYWLGELYGLMGKNDQSISEFANVVKNYPDSPKIADAQLKLGLIYAAQLKWTDARSSFKKVINHYPGTASAHLASEQLKQIKQAGN